MKALPTLLIASLLSGCASYNAADTMAHGTPETQEMGRCGGGLQISNALGAKISEEAQKTNGELSAEQRSNIFAYGVESGLLSAHEKNYDIYVKCILELDKRRSEALRLQERLQQPALKVYLKTDDSLTFPAKRLVVENTGEELTELKVMPAPFLLVNDLCVIRTPSDCREAESTRLATVYIPIENYYALGSSGDSYKGVLHEVDEDNARLREVAQAFTVQQQRARTGSMNQGVVTVVRLRYKDKFQTQHERYMDVTTEQQELSLALGQALFAERAKSIEAGLWIDAQSVSTAQLERIWTQAERPSSALPEVWRLYRAVRRGA
ncbi:hypothetical protein P0Y43_18440 [Pseudomonas entomophila]|uniref:hypothetical protein n=1 Tax=Pseudomonas entomophila TaxID=312306 RepID=UPI0023D7DD6A|nr:hypothetical protein [Pseudomonas entomophila]MDF0732670.1 hypothetical protein [Pseudomonas entomophila]